MTCRICQIMAICGCNYILIHYDFGLEQLILSVYLILLCNWMSHVAYTLLRFISSCEKEDVIFTLALGILVHYLDFSKALLWLRTKNTIHFWGTWCWLSAPEKSSALPVMYEYLLHSKYLVAYTEMDPLQHKKSILISRQLWLLFRKQMPCDSKGTESLAHVLQLSGWWSHGMLCRALGMLSAVELVLCEEVLCQGGSAIVFLLFFPFLLEPLEIRDFRVL